MKLLRYGPPGQEKPGVLDIQGRVRDLSSYLPDVAGSALLPEALVRPGLLLHRQADQADATGQRRLAVALPHFHKGATEATNPQAGNFERRLPPEQSADDEALRGLGIEGLAFELPLRQPIDVLKGLDFALGERAVPTQAALRAVLQILEMPPAGVTDVRPRDDAACDDILCIFRRPVRRSSARSGRLRHPHPRPKYASEPQAKAPSRPQAP